MHRGGPEVIGADAETGRENYGAPVGGAAILPTPPPSTSGLGHHPFKVAARVRIPLGACRPHGRAVLAQPCGSFES